VRAREAEQVGSSFTARWHLDRLIAARPDDGLLYAHRARTWTAERNWERADADYRQAAQKAGPQVLIPWYRQRAWACLAAGQNEAARWYLDRLIAQCSGECRLYQQRAAALARLDENDLAQADLDRALDLTGDELFIDQQAREHARAGRWQRAADLLGRVKIHPGTMDFAYGQCLARLKTGDLTGYHRTCAAARDTLPGLDQTDLYHTLYVVELHSLSWQSTDACEPLLARLQQLLTRLDAAVREDPQSQRTLEPRRRLMLLARGLLYYRLRDQARAVESLRASCVAHRGGGDFEDRLFLALALHAQKNTTAAQRWWKKALQSYTPGAGNRWSWDAGVQEWLVAEAKGVFGADME
jgi:tetratricopeptide (TPR) repeat protein